MLEREDIEAVIACLGDDAAQLRNENPEDERADNMDRAATMLRELADSNAAVARLLLDQDREGAKGWARGIHLDMDSEGGLTAGVTVLPGQQEVTEAMKLAGVREMLDASPDEAWEERIARVYIAMRNAGVMVDAVAQERERCAAIADDEARIREEAGRKHPEESAPRDRCFAAARAAANVAKGIRSGEVVAGVTACSGGRP